MKKLRMNKEIWLILLAVLLLAALAVLMAAIDGKTFGLQGWLAYATLLGVGTLGVYGTWRAVEASRAISTIAIIAFVLRLGIGIALTLLLPVVGYQNNVEHQAGYVYTDAYIRDGQSWDLASSSRPLTDAFSGAYSGDQYGGMLAISALLYRFLSPDAHRPLLILTLNAALSAIGILCLWKALRSWFNEKTALLAAWLFALYPESILLGSSQMREAVLIPLTATSLYGLRLVQGKKLSGWVWLLISALLMFLIQPLAGFVSFAVLLGAWLFDPLTMKARQGRQTLLVVVLLLGVLGVAMLVVSSILANLPSLKENNTPLGIFLSWFQNNFTYQSYLTERSSGIFQSLLDSLGEQWRWLIVLVYGIAQPVLPAIVGDPSAAWIMRIIGFLRAAGWYALALFLVYGTLGLLRSRDEKRRRQLGWISLVSWAWIMVAALNAGADQWDNPRYRVILLLWQVVLAAWAWNWAVSRRDAWLWRWLAVEVVFVAMFTEWYLGRYYPGFFHLDIKWMILLTLVTCGAILLGGFVWDRRHSREPIIPDNRL